MRKKNTLLAKFKQGVVFEMMIAYGICGILNARLMKAAMAILYTGLSGQYLSGVTEQPVVYPCR